MMTFFGSRECTYEEWRNIIKDADTRFELRFADMAPGGYNNILGIIWNG